MSNGLGNSFGRSHRKWEELKAWSKVNQPWICWLCGGRIDPGLPKNDRMSWTLDHILSKEDYPELVHEQSNVAPAHRKCNSAKGKRLHKPGGLEKPSLPKTSRKWF